MISEETKQIVQEYAQRLFDECWVDYDFLKDKKMKPLDEDQEMKPLTKEQHDTIVAWMKDKCDYMIQEFSKDFETCESDPRLSAFQVFTEAYDESKAKVDKTFQAQNILLSMNKQL
jgi:hypothetical protein